MNTTLMIREDLAVKMTPDSATLKLAALDAAAFVRQVSDKPSLEICVEAQTSLETLIRDVEKQRVALKAPVLEFGRAIDAAAKTFCEPLKAEQIRLAKLAGDYHALEEARVRAAAQAESERLAQIERERAEAIAKAKSHEELDRINEQFSQRAQAEAPPPETITPTRVDGQRIAHDWDVTVTDIWLLAKAHPACVKIEPRMSEIKALLKAGVRVAGVLASPTVKATTTKAKVIEV